MPLMHRITAMQSQPELIHGENPAGSILVRSWALLAPPPPPPLPLSLPFPSLILFQFHDSATLLSDPQNLIKAAPVVGAISAPS